MLKIVFTNVNSWISISVKKKTEEGGSLYSFPEAEFKCHNKLDMVILLDSSASVPEDVFETTKKFAADLVKHFDISKDRANVAVMSYSQYVHVERKFDDEASQESVLRTIDGVKYEGSFTRLNFALEVIHNKIFTKAQGARSSSKGKRKMSWFCSVVKC